MAITPPPPPVTPDSDPQRWFSDAICASLFQVERAWSGYGPYVKSSSASSLPISYALHYITQGKIGYHFSQRHLIAEHGQMVILPPRLARAMEPIGRRQPVVCYMRFKCMPGRPDPWRTVDLPAVVTVPDPDVMERTMVRLIDFSKLIYTEPCARLHALTALLEVFSIIIPEGFRRGQLRLTTDRTPESSRVVDIIQVLQERVYDPALTIHALADQAGISPSQFTRAFQRHVGISPKRYIQQSRLEWAGMLLLAGDSAPIGDIANRCGYNDPFHFSTQFRKHFGCSPTTYRQQRRPTSK